MRHPARSLTLGAILAALAVLSWTAARGLIPVPGITTHTAAVRSDRVPLEVEEAAHKAPLLSIGARKPRSCHTCSHVRHGYEPAHHPSHSGRRIARHVHPAHPDPIRVNRQTRSLPKEARSFSHLPGPAPTVRTAPIIRAAPTPTAVPQRVTLIIPRLGIVAPIYERGLDATDSMQIAPGYAATHYLYSARPGQRGNAVIYGHDDIEGSIFRYLPDMQVGDPVYITSSGHRYTYRVIGRKIVEPGDVSVLLPSRNATLTLFSCTPYDVDTQRIVITAVLVR